MPIVILVPPLDNEDTISGLFKSLVTPGRTKQTIPVVIQTQFLFDVYRVLIMDKWVWLQIV